MINLLIILLDNNLVTTIYFKKNNLMFNNFKKVKDPYIFVTLTNTELHQYVT